MSPAEQVRAFLDALFPGDLEADERVTTSKDNGKNAPRSVHWMCTDKAVNAIAGDRAQCQFVNLATRAKGLSASQRGGIKDVRRIGALWVDIDVAGPGHATDTVAAAEHAALWLIGQFPLPVSIIVHSGGGLHGYWLLDELHDAAEVVPLLARWSTWWQWTSETTGVPVDPSVFNIACMMRLPGTMNAKVQPLRPTSLRELHLDCRYAIEDIDRHLGVPDTFKPAQEARKAGGGSTDWKDLTEEDLEKLHPLTCATWEVVRDKFGGTDPILVERGGLEPPYLQVVRRVADHGDDKGDRGGLSATIGFVGPDVLYVFTSAWSPFRAYHSYGLEALNIIDADGPAVTAMDALKADDERRNGTTTSSRSASTSDDGVGQVSEVLTPPVDVNLPDEFWSARPILEHVRQAAWSRVLSADAVLGAVLVRAAWLTDYRIVLPAVVGRHGALNLLAGIVGPPGTGKGSAADVAAELIGCAQTALPTDYRVREAPAGSGEGVTAAFMEMVDVTEGKKNRTEWRQTYQGVLLRVDEVETLGKLGDRSGSTLWTVWRSGWSGEALGFSNASVDRRRPVIPALGYRLCGLVGIQPALAGSILADTAGGTPQRFLWMSTMDRNVPDTPPLWPGPLRWAPPRWQIPDDAVRTVGGFRRRVLEVDTAIADDLRAAQLAKVRGAAQTSFDGHRGLNLLKIAGVLAVLDGRLNIDAEDWDLAAMVLNTSDRVRTKAGDEVRAKGAAEETRRIDYARRRAGAEQVGRTAVQHDTQRVAGVITRYVDRNVPPSGATRSDLLKALSPRDRHLFDAALAVALATGGVLLELNRYYQPGAVAP